MGRPQIATLLGQALIDSQNALTPTPLPNSGEGLVGILADGCHSQLDKPFMRIGGLFILRTIPLCCLVLWSAVYIISIYALLSPNFGEFIVQIIQSAKGN
jgi:hypothetical protein